MQFMLLIYQPHPFDPKALSPEAYEEVAKDYAAINQTPGVTSGPPLGLTSKAVTVRVTDGETAATEGPYAGAAHAVGGTLLLDAESLDAAVALAARIPAARLGGAVEVRPCEVYW